VNRPDLFRSTQALLTTEIDRVWHVFRSTTWRTPNSSVPGDYGSLAGLMKNLKRLAV